MKDIRFSADGLEVAIFKPGVYHGGTSVITDADIDELIATYDASVHEAPCVLGHRDDRQPGDQAYGWVDELFKRDGMLWARLKQVPDEFVEWVQEGLWKKRSIEMWSDFRNTGRKYLAAIAWLGADAPEVKGLPDVAWAEDAGEVVTYESATNNVLKRLYQHLRDLFQDEGLIEKTMLREDAMQQLERIRWIASDELWRIIYDEELAAEDKRSQVSALFEELSSLLEENGETIVNSFAERSESMSKPNADAGDGTVTLTKAELAEIVNDAATSAVEQYEEKTAATIDEKVSEGLADITYKTKRNAIGIYCDRLKERGMAPALLDESTGLAVFMERLDYREAITFAEGKEQTALEFFQELLGNLLDAAKGNKLVVEFKEVGGADKRPSDDTQSDAQARAAVEFAENREFYELMEVSEEDLANSIDR